MLVVFSNFVSAYTRSPAAISPAPLPLPLARLSAERVRGIPVLAPQHTRGITLDHVERLPVVAHDAGHTRPEQARAQLGRAHRGHKCIRVS